METFSSKALRRHREARCLTREAVAVAIGRSAASIGFYETGRITPPRPIIGALAQTLEIPVSDLFAPIED
jgi:transcriptional regulator with XRE-family HTH domain